MDRRSWTDEQLIDAVKNSNVYSDIIRRLGLQVRPGNYKTVKKYIKKLNLDISHFVGWKSNSGGAKPRSLEEILVENSDYSRKKLKERILRNKLLEEKCQICRLDPVWQEERLILILDHINGVNNDNRIENLRLICPNCNAQTKTFCRGQKRKKIEKFCIDCGTKVYLRTKTSRCYSCASKLIATKIDWPEPTKVLKMVEESSFVEAAKELKVSDNAVRKFLKRNNLL